ncbi:MAG: DUF421 domain-containing protein [Gluconacetobacter diazotrophicus]|nr:DUF421 domain-containing protein [Gluconacetobacter diazotrophicus]
MRGTLVYLALFALLRVTRRQSGHIGTSDVLVIVLIADAVQNAMASDYHSITEGLCLALTIFFWSWCLDFLSVHVPALRRLIEAPPRLVVEDGRIDRRVLRRELMTVDDLHAQLRLQGVHDLSEVRRARIEGDGQLSIQRRSG